MKGKITMKFSCDKDYLFEAVSAAMRAVATKAANPALEGVYISAENGAVKVVGYDGDIAVSAVTDAIVAEEGAVVLGSHLFSEMLRRFNKGTVDISCDNAFFTDVKNNLTNYKINGISPDDYPALPEMSAENSLRFPQNVLKSMLKQTVFSMSNAETKLVLNGCFFHIEGSLVKIVAVDGHRLAIREEIIDTGSVESTSFIVPAKTVNEVLKLLSDEEGKTVYIEHTRRQIIFKIDNVTLISRLIEGDFIDYSTIANKKTSIDCRLDPKEFLAGIERTALLTNEKLRMPIRAVFEGDRVLLNCKTVQGWVHDEINCKTVGGELEIGFTDKYMTEALRVINDDEIYVRLDSNLSPIIIEPVAGTSYKFVIMPIRLK